MPSLQGLLHQSASRKTRRSTLAVLYLLNKPTLVFISFAIFSALFASSCTDPASKLPNYGVVPPFTMTDSSGHSFSSSALSGKVWVADFIYTNCPAECPMMTSKMRKVEQKIRGEKDVRLVSFSVDPERDTPPVLDAFAHRFGGPTPQWYFLTGTPHIVHVLAYETFHVGDVLGKIEHSTKFILIDKRGNIRGYYSTFDEDGIPTMLRDLSALRKERTS
jgi:protein SCO1/2